MLRGFSLPFCSLYELGYTSLGKQRDTKPNPALLRPSGLFINLYIHLLVVRIASCMASGLLHLLVIYYEFVWSSLGKPRDTKPNPALLRPSGTFTSVSLSMHCCMDYFKYIALIASFVSGNTDDSFKLAYMLVSL